MSDVSIHGDEILRDGLAVVSRKRRATAFALAAVAIRQGATDTGDAADELSADAVAAALRATVPPRIIPERRAVFRPQDELSCGIYDTEQTNVMENDVTDVTDVVTLDTLSALDATLIL
jgi:hypothetical protein